MKYELILDGIMPNLNDYLKGERITIRKDGVNLNEQMNGGKYRLIVNQ